VPNNGICHVDVWEIGCTAPAILTSALDGDEWPAGPKIQFKLYRIINSVTSVET
jgi:hypothetical protein